MSKQLEGAPFASILTKRPRFYSDHGSHYRKDYEIRIDKKGHKILEEVGEHDEWAEIQSYKEECDISNIIARAAAGDLNALNQRQGIYADISDTPRDLAEAQNNILKLNNEFYKLSPEIREKFDNSKEKFVNTFGTVEWYEALGIKTENTEKTENIDFIPDTTKEAKEVLTPNTEA